MLRGSSIVVVIAAVVCVIPSLALAQADQPFTFTITIGGKPAAGLQIFFVPDQQPVLLGTMGSSGTLTVDHLDYVKQLRAIRRAEAYNWTCDTPAESAVYYFDGRIIDLPTFKPEPKPGCTFSAGGSAKLIGAGWYYDTMSFDKPRGSHWNVVWGGGAKLADYSNFAEGAATIESQLRGLNYNSIASETKSRRPGFELHMVVDFGPVRFGAEVEHLGTATTNVTASRINVTGSPLNVAFTSSTELSVNLINLPVGAGFSVGRFTVIPSVVPGWARVEATTQSTLLGGPTGPTPPTTPVSSNTVTTNVTKFGVGWNARVEFAVNSRVALAAQYQSRTIRNVFSQPNEARLEQDLHSRGALVAFLIRTLTARARRS